MQTLQRGGTFMGFIAGLIIGLGAALAVAVYVAKVPVPFLSKNGTRSAEQDAAEAQKNRNWDPNSPLYGKNPARPGGSPEPSAKGEGGAEEGFRPPPKEKPVSAASGTVTTSDAEASAKTAAAKDRDKPEKTPLPKVEAKRDSKSPEGDPLGDLAKAKAALAGEADVFDYFLQAGAFRTQVDAEAQKAKLAMMGWEARVSEREQNGRPVFRVRVGPFAKREAAEQFKDKLGAAGIESALVRVAR